jgi:heme oxygenase (mycobilin-producing)
MLIRVVRMTFREGKTEKFLDIFRDSCSKIKGMAGCTHLELLQDFNEPNVYSTYSIWHSEEDLNNYRKSELFGIVWKQTKALFAAPAVAQSYKKMAV